MKRSILQAAAALLAAAALAPGLCGAMVIETFPVDVDPFPDAVHYTDWSLTMSDAGASGATAKVSGGVLAFAADSGSAATLQAVAVQTATDLFGSPTFGDCFHVSADVGATTAGLPANRVVGISVGNIAAMYRPGYSYTGADGKFAWRLISGGSYFGEAGLGWVPSMGTVPLQTMRVDVYPTGSNYTLVATITEGAHWFSTSCTVTSAQLGTLDNVGLIMRSATVGATGLYDNFTVTIPEPAAIALWVGGIGILVWARWRRGTRPGAKTNTAQYYPGT